MEKYVVASNAVQAAWISRLKVGYTVASAQIKIKLNLHFTRGITPKCVASDGAYFCGLTHGQHNSEETWRQLVAGFGNAVSDLTDPKIKLQTFRTKSNVLNS